MRVFYEELRNYYVKLDNVNVPEELKGFKSIDALTTKELIEKTKLNFDILD
mgnify:CR=1 FL=1